MDSILYYSNFCGNSKIALQMIGKSHLKDNMHFICVDNRRVEDNGQVVAILETGKEIRLPPNLKSVPAVLLLNRGYRLLTGSDILEYIQPKLDALNKAATGAQGEPMAYSFSGGGHIASDTFSFLDQTAEELEAKGDGGAKQLYHYARPGQDYSIETPPDAGESEKKKPDQPVNYSTNI